MRIGAPVSGYDSAEAWVKLHVDKGLGAAYWPLREGVPADEEAAYVAAAEAHGLVIAEVGVWNNPLDSDPAAREANVRHAIARLRTADRVGARCCVNITGSRSAVWDGPHPENLTDETFDEIVRTTRRILDEAAPHRTRYALETMPWAYPCDTDSMQRLLDAVGRDALGVHVDMVNLINTPEKVYRTGALTRDFFARFGPRICSVHAKDVTLSDMLTVHIDEAIPGDGIFDFDALLTECAKLHDIPVMAEHLQTDAQYAKAVGFLRQNAASLGVRVEVAK